MKTRLKISRFEVLAYMVLIVLGLVATFTATLVLGESSAWLQVAINVGSDLIIIGGLFFYYRALLIDPASQLNEIVEKTPTLLKSGIAAGVEQLHLTRDGVSREEWMGLIRGAKHELGILAIAMQQYTAQADFPALIADLQRKGVSCRIILVHPASDDVRQRSVMDDPLSFAPVEEYILRSLNRLKLELSGLGIVRLHRLAHTCDVVWADDTMYVTFYLAGGPGGTSPCMKVIRKHGGVFDRYQRHFDALWDAKGTMPLEEFLDIENGGKST